MMAVEILCLGKSDPKNQSSYQNVNFGILVYKAAISAHESWMGYETHDTLSHILTTLINNQ